MSHYYYKLHKPYGVLSQFGTNDKHQKRKRFLSELYDFETGTMPVGRLDEASEGLLLLTTDGKLSDDICKGLLEKEYYAQLDGVITDSAISELRQGVTIGFEGTRYLTLPCEVCKLDNDPDFPERTKKIRDERHGPTSWISIIINEGKFRQVRKMTSAVGFPTLRLVRVRIGAHQLSDMKSGAVVVLDHLV